LTRTVVTVLVLIMNTPCALIDELEGALANAEISRRANVLERVTDLFVAHSGQLSDSQILLFDDIMVRLLHEVDDKSREKVGRHVVQMETAPPGVIRELALDNSIIIAGPILTGSDQIHADVLVESAMTKSQDHLLAISKRRQLPESVTDVLVERGNHQVVVSTTENSGASFSEFGYTALVGRAEDDHDLAASVWKRPDIPRQHLLTLFTAASEAVQRELQAINPRKADEIRALVWRASDELQCRSRHVSPEYLAARAHVELLQEFQSLSESRLQAFATANRFSETTIALSLMCDVPVAIVKRAITHSHCDQLLVLTKSIGVSFDTVKAILSMQTKEKDGICSDLEEISASFSKLSQETARKTLQYYRLRARTLSN
jgi:uncharacterized protein (DUF2336 family)